MSKKLEKPLRYEALLRQVCHEKGCGFDRSASMQFSNKKEEGEVKQKLYSAHYVDQTNAEHDKKNHRVSYMEIVKQVVSAETKEG